MKQQLKFLLLLSVTVFLSGCKLALIVVEGGEVRSYNSGICMAGSVCIVEVTGTDFWETFTAIPDTGWYFQKWNSGSGFFCQGSTDPVCVVSGVGTEGNEGIEAIVASDATFYIMPVFILPQSTTDTVTVDGKEWAQADQFLNLSWDQINAVCPDGVCDDSNLLNGYDMTGWTWASSDDIDSLFTFYEEIGKRLLDDFSYTRAEEDGDTGIVVSHTLLAMIAYSSEYNGGGIAMVGDSQPIAILPLIQGGSAVSNSVGAWFWRAL